MNAQRIMYTLPDKKLSFEYLLTALVKWQCETRDFQDNDLSILKVLKLTFFVSAASVGPDKQNGLLEVFNNFHALPYGHVESDIYNFIKLDALRFYRLDHRKTALKDIETIPDSRLFREAGLVVGYQKKIDSAVSDLKLINATLINEDAFKLVALSHLWYSWKKNYHFAQIKGDNAGKIPEIEIVSESKIYSY